MIYMQLCLQISVSFFEIYKDEIYDLLNLNSSGKTTMLQHGSGRIQDRHLKELKDLPTVCIPKTMLYSVSRGDVIPVIPLLWTGHRSGRCTSSSGSASGKKLYTNKKFASNAACVVQVLCAFRLARTSADSLRCHSTRYCSKLK